MEKKGTDDVYFTSSQPTPLVEEEFSHHYSNYYPHSEDDSISDDLSDDIDRDPEQFYSHTTTHTRTHQTEISTKEALGVPGDPIQASTGDAPPPSLDHQSVDPPPVPTGGTPPGGQSVQPLGGALPLDHHRGYPMDWNAEFQRLLELPEDTKEAQLEKNLKISALSKDFVAKAKRWGKVIIEEAFLPGHYRTIKPIDIGGHAGGMKFMYNGILFKLQTDWKGIYGGDFYAMKTGGLELKGLMRYYGCKGIHVPLMAILDYRGFRLVAMSRLPIGTSSLVYGSGNGGRTVHTSHEGCNGVMREAARKLNIKGHLCGHTMSVQKFLYGPVDIEGHMGTDGRFYVLDFARVYPPTAEPNVHTTYLYKIFRPEYIKRYQRPLSSDAFSPFSALDPRQREHELEVTEATLLLVGTVVPRFASWLDEHHFGLGMEVHLTNLCEGVHREGINIRYLGLVRTNVKSDFLKRFILMEMVARVVKNSLRGKLRSTMQKMQTLAGDIFNHVVLRTFNEVLGHNGKSEYFWRSLVKKELDFHFKGGLDPLEVDESFHLKSRLDVHLLFLRMQQLTGVKLTKYARKEFEKNKDDFKLVIADVKTMRVKVKKMNIISLAEGNALAIQAMDALSGDRSHHHDRLFRFAMSKFDSAIHATPDNSHMLNHYGDILSKVALLKTKAEEETYGYFEKALEKYKVFSNPATLLKLGNILQETPVLWSEEEKIRLLADACYSLVINTGELTPQAYQCRGMLYLSQGRCGISSVPYQKSGEMFRKSIMEFPMPGFDWLSEWYHTLDDVELAVAVEITRKTDNNKDPPLTRPDTFDARRCSNPLLVTDALVGAFAKNLKMKAFFLKGCTQITSVAMESLALCHNLTHLDLSGNPTLSDQNLSLILSPKLTSLHVSSCTLLSKQVFVDITKKCTSLTELDVSHCAFESNYLADIEWLGARNLKVLDLSYTKLDPGVWELTVPFVNLTNLVEINLSGCDQITDKCITVLVKDHAVHLTSLQMSYIHGLTDMALYSVSQYCHQMVHLDVSGCTLLTPRSLTFMGAYFTALKSLRMDGCINVFEEDVCSFSLMAQNNWDMEIISFNQTKANDKILSTLALWKNLTQIGFDSTPISEEGISVLTKHVGGLKTISLAFCSKIQDSTLDLIAKASGPTLTSLNLHGCHNITDPAVKILARHCRNLKILNLSWISINGLSLKTLSKHARSLSHLNLSHCSIHTKNIDFIASMHSLTLLDLSSNKLISDIRPLAKGCPKLLTLVLQDCEHVDVASLCALASLPYLRVCNIVGCRPLDIDQLLLLFEDERNWPNLEKLHYGGRGTKFSEEALKKFQATKARAELSEYSSTQTLEIPSSPSIPLRVTSTVSRTPSRNLTTRCAGTKHSPPQPQVQSQLPHQSEKHKKQSQQQQQQQQEGSLQQPQPPYQPKQGLVQAVKPSVLPPPPQKLKKLHKYIPSVRPTPQPPQSHQKRDTPPPSQLPPPQPSPLPPPQPPSQPPPPQPPQPSQPSTQRATRRLMHDLKEIQRDPLPHVSAHPVSDDMLLWHCNLEGPEDTPYVGGVFHLQLKFPENYPLIGPSATLFTPLPHPNVHNYRICMDILSDYSSFFREQEQASGWKSHFTIQTILTQMQMLMVLPTDKGPMYNVLSQIPAAIQMSKKFKCQICEHGPDCIWPPFQARQTPVPYLEIDVIKDELKCLYTRVPFTEDTLGISIHIIRNNRSDTINEIMSPLDLISRTAYNDGLVPPATFWVLPAIDWMPIYICEEHGTQASSQIEQAIARICKKTQFQPELTFEVLPKLITSMVVDVCKGKIHASKGLEGYICFHRLMIHFVQTYPHLIEKANNIVHNFIASEDNRTKEKLPNLGVFLTLLYVSDLQWDDVAKCYLEESFIRNVMWLIQKYPELSKETPDPEIDKNRPAKTLLATIVSQRHLLHQLLFLRHIGRPPGKTLDDIAKMYDANYGRPSNQMKEMFLDGVIQIRAINTWEGFFQWTGIECPPPEMLSNYLRECVLKSFRKGYHKNRLDTSNREERNVKRVQTSHGRPKMTRYYDGGRTRRRPDYGREGENNLCRFFHNTGGCPYGRDCRFTHMI